MSLAARRSATVLVALLLAWRILQVNVVLYDDNGRPRLQPLDDNPAQVQALLLVAADRERAGSVREARRAYDTAFELAPVDREVLGAGAGFFLRQGDVAHALLLVDRLVDSYPETRERAFPALAQLLAEGREPATWKAILARKPAWIGAFIVSACEQGMDPGLLAPLLLDRVAQHRATKQETACVIDRLRDADRWAEAYQVWLNTLPRERMADVGNVFNGSFEFVSNGVGFDWRYTAAPEREAGHSVEVAQTVGADGRRALRVSFNGKRQAGIPVAQYLALAPGRYELSGLALVQSVAAGRGVQWTIRCVAARKPGPAIATSERFVGSSEWRRFTVAAQVPAACPGQVLQLEPAGMDEGVVYLAGTAWFDDLQLRRR